MHRLVSIAVRYSTDGQKVRRGRTLRVDVHLSEAEERAAYGGYRLIEADGYVARGGLARLCGDEDGVGVQCRAAIGICGDPECGYAWAKEEAEGLMRESTG